ncbi:hypothetical protein SLS56_011048 [Neofusicoccum ribis]|uniref:Peptidase S8/S53 domain-containing protein n=1 Tax=Neofusicoccum ribis TaxID=45134 RepID=A0ABR3SCQ3_9PEZI
MAQFQKSDTDIPEFCDGESVMHKYPKVLALGILLIEIAKGEILEACRTLQRYDDSSTNEYFISAWSSLSNGVLGEDDDYTTYREAVKQCLDFDLFAEAPYLPGQSRPEKSLRERRAILYSKVVSPLKKLLEGTGWFSEIDEIKQEPHFQPTIPSRREASKMRAPSAREFHGELEQDIDALALTGLPNPLSQPMLLAGKPKWTPGSWLDKMDSINSMLSAQGNAVQPVKIAVLDTGCSLDSPIFLMEGQEARLKDRWKDWVESSPKPTDENGHGNRIVSLLLRIAPNAEIFVARVAKNPRSLQKSDSRIAQAIRHAALEWGVDIISVSFGFPNEMDSIRQAIHAVEVERKHSLIFFAAAANDGSNTAELFPAFMDSVISVRGTDTSGDFIPLYDPEVPRYNHGKQVYGTLGQDVPCGWPDDYPSMLLSGCSVATPIAAGIAAMIMQCAASRPDQFSERDQRRIRTRRGITEIFYDISVERGNERFYVAPWKLFMNSGELRVKPIGAAIERLP